MDSGKADENDVFVKHVHERIVGGKRCYMETNYEKYDIYRAMKLNLKKSMTAEFYYQAIFIEYAIIEDRCSSMLKHAGVKYLDSKGREVRLSEKIRKLRGNPCFDNKNIRKYISLEFLQNIQDWKNDRDHLIHALAKIPYDDESIKQIAIEGQEIVNSLDNKSKKINHYFDTVQNEKEE